MHGAAAREAGSGRPERIVRRRQQQFVAVVEQGVGGHHNQFAGAVAQVNVVQRDTPDALLLGVMHHGLARAKNTFAVGVTRGTGQIANHVLLDFFRRVEPKHGQIANVEFDDFVPLFFHLAGGVHDGSTYVVTDVGQFAGFSNGLQSPSGRAWHGAKPII